jgi:hypothetical protein
MLTRTPYNAAGRVSRFDSPRLAAVVPQMYDTAAAAGSIIVYQDVRGRHGSEGDYVLTRPLRGPLNPTAVDHATDCYDTIDWLVKNVPESNGRVATMGGSYEGYTTLMSTVHPHPALVAGVAFAPMVDGWMGDDWFHNGAFRQGMALAFITLLLVALLASLVTPMRATASTAGAAASPPPSPAAGADGAPGRSPAADAGAPTGSVHDFAYFAGGWTTRQRRLVARGVGSTEWDEFPATLCMRPYLEGVVTVDEMHLPTKGWAGVTVRAFDLEKGQWSIYWINSQNGRVDPPVVGGFDGDRGEFFGDDVDGGRPVKVRYLWTKIDRDHARWEQAFSYDGARTWETNWTADFQRADAAQVCEAGRPRR